MVTPAGNRNTRLKISRLERRRGSPSSSGASVEPQVSGTNMSAGFQGHMPRKSRGAMPTIVANWPLRRTTRPTARGSEFKYLRQKRSLTTTTGAMPGFSVSELKKRPEAGVKPRVEKYSGETRCP
jgi:hypothetical protein